MTDRGQWLINLETKPVGTLPDGLVAVSGYSANGRPPEEVAIIEKAQSYNAQYVFFEAGQNGRPAAAQAFVFISDNRDGDQQFALLHKRLWSWGGVPLIYRKTPGLVQLFRCAHKPDFVSPSGQIICKPIKTLSTAASIASSEAWWDATRLRNGTLWDDPAVCKLMMSASKSAHKHLIEAVKQLNKELNDEGILKRHLRRRLLILSLLIAYLEERGVFPTDYLGQFLKGANKFFQVLANGKALVALLADLEERFNGHVFTLDDADRATLRGSAQLVRFAKLVEAHEEANGQLTLWELYSFRDLPVELISHIYQQFVTDNDSSVYTPPFLVRLMLEEALSWERLDQLQSSNEVILDPACGSGVFLVEAYKRLVLHWRSRNEWKRPRTADLKRLLKKVHGIDLEQGAIELAAFSLCLALCDALEPEEIRSSIKLFPQLQGKTLHHSCFFDAKEAGLVKDPVGVLLGNPPFESKLTTPGAERSCALYEEKYGFLPDKQLGYLFLHEAMELVAEGGVLSMLQQYGFLYNQHSRDFRRSFFERWDVREVLDFISVRGLFQKGGADTKVLVVVAVANKPKADRKVLHAVFRRSGRVDAEQGFDIDYYDMHWLSRAVVLNNDAVWRADLLGGSRVLAYTDRLARCPTLAQFAEAQGWDYGEGYIEGRRGVSRPADHIVGKPLLPSEALTLDGIDESQITLAEKKVIEGARSAARFTPPMLLVREHMDLPHQIWSKSYLTYKNKIVGFAAPPKDQRLLSQVAKLLSTEAAALQAFAAVVSVRLFTQKATTLSAADILSLPVPPDWDLDLSANERIVVDDLVRYSRDLIRLGEGSDAMKESGEPALAAFNETLLAQVNNIYKKKPLKALSAQTWPGVICQPFVFGDGAVDWTGAVALQDKLNALLCEQKGSSLHVTRVARVYDKQFVFLLKPDRLRYWLRSMALRDSDEILADLRALGF